MDAAKALVVHGNNASSIIPEFLVTTFVNWDTDGVSEGSSCILPHRTLLHTHTHAFPPHTLHTHTHPHSQR